MATMIYDRFSARAISKVFYIARPSLHPDFPCVSPKNFSLTIQKQNLTLHICLMYYLLSFPVAQW